MKNENIELLKEKGIFSEKSEEEIRELQASVYLSEQEFVVFCLKEVLGEDFSHEEIGEKLDINAPTSGKYYSRAKDKIRRAERTTELSKEL